MQTSLIAIARRAASVRTVLQLSKCALAAATLASSAALAIPITYTETFTTSGSLGSVAFDDALVTLTLTGDTANVTSPVPGEFFNLGTMTVRVGGSSATFTDQMEAVSIDASAFVGGDASVGLSDQTRDLAVGFARGGSVVASYDLRTAIDPVTGQGNGVEPSDFPTTDGMLDFDAVGAPIIVTFSAAVPDASASVPEPSELLLLVAGLIGMGSITRKNVASRGRLRAIGGRALLRLRSRCR
jgi:hypothetical protein